MGYGMGDFYREREAGYRRELKRCRLWLGLLFLGGFFLGLATGLILAL